MKINLLFLLGVFYTQIKCQILKRTGKGEYGMQALEAKIRASVESIKGKIAEKMDSGAFSSWISPLDIKIVSDTLVLTAQNQFSADFINGVYYNILNTVANESGLDLKITVAGRAKSENTTANDNKSEIFQPVVQNTQNEKSSFSDFVISAQNAFAVSACKKLTSGGANFSPLFIYGPQGCGKSLLAKCIDNEISGRTLFMTGGTFVSEFIRAMNNHSIFAFKDFCRNCDTFIMDDVGQIAGKRASMDEFLQLIIDLKAANKNIVITSDNAPGNISGFDRRAQSLMASGLTVDIVVPDANVKKTMLVRGGVSLNVAEDLASRICCNGHAVSGVINKINTYRELMGEKVTIDVANKILSDVLQQNKTPIAMVRAMSVKLGVSFDAVCSSSRVRGLVRARQIMMAALKQSTTLSLSEIGTIIGGRDHASVLYAIKQIEIAKSSDLMLGAEIAEMTNLCK